MREHLLDWVGQNFLRPPMRRVLASYLARSRATGSSRHVCIYYAPNGISFSQIFPFLFYHRDFRQAFDVDFRFVPVEHLLAGHKKALCRADVILIQPWFDVSRPRLDAALDRLKTANPNSRISFMDSFAHNDLRLADILDPYIEFYFKKSLFRDRDLYLRPFRGDTNLTEYYSDLYEIPAEPVDWKVPPAILPKLRLCPGFFTAPGLIRGFSPGDRPTGPARTIDIHARLGVRGADWYSRMREASLTRLKALETYEIAREGSVDWARYMGEMRQSKLCFSPFGYGELCWRDIEAYMTGAVLVKPDMGHLETLPNLFIPDETYASISWDFNDLEAVVTGLLENDDRRHNMALGAFDRTSAYLRDRKFVEDMSVLFQP